METGDSPDNRGTAVATTYDTAVTWNPRPPQFKLTELSISWFLGAIGVVITAEIVPGVSVSSFGGALVAAGLIAVFNAVLPPIVASLRLPFTLGLGFFLILALDAAILLIVSDITTNGIQVHSLGPALVAALVLAATTLVLEVIFGANDDDTYTLRVVTRIAKRQGNRTQTEVPGIIFLEIDGLALPVLQRAMRDGNAPEMARWMQLGTHELTEWETDLSSQTGASQAGILLGCNDDIPAFRWVEKETGRVVACSSPSDCAALEARLATGKGLLIDDGASRGNLFSGEADAMILTVSQMGAEKRANPGYRAFLANGFNVTRMLVLSFWELVLEWTAATRQRRREVHPRGERGGIYPFLRAAVCVGVRDLIVFGVLTDMMRGRPAVYATFSSYDEVAHHSGLERADTLEALRKLDQQIARINRACQYAPRPYRLVVLSDHGQTQGATFKQRNGYDLSALVERSSNQAKVSDLGAADEHDAAVRHAMGEATGRVTDEAGEALPERQVVVLGSGNLGLVYLMEKPRRLTREELDARHPRLLPALREHPHIAFLLVRDQDGPVVLGPRGERHLGNDRVVGEDPLAPFSPNAAAHLMRTDSFSNAPDILVNSFYDPELEQGCAFEELISFHGGLGGPQTRPFILHPAELAVPGEPIIGAVAVHDLLAGWRRALQESAPAAAAPA